MNRVREQSLWNHVKQHRRPDVIRSEYRARYEIIKYSAILRHMIVHVDPSTAWSHVTNNTDCLIV